MALVLKTIQRWMSPGAKKLEVPKRWATKVNLNNRNVSALIARELSGFSCTRLLKMNSKFSIPREALIRRLQVVYNLRKVSRR